MGKKHVLGKVGEQHCIAYLAKNGYNVINQNYHSRYGEIDIIAIYKHFLVFIEVKTRTNEELDHILTSITHSKQKKITKTALYFLKDYQNNDVQEYRFDVMILQKDGESFIVHHYENAFLPAEVGDFY